MTQGKHTPRPCAWVIPGDDHADINGFIDARVIEGDEFTKPLYDATALTSLQSRIAALVEAMEWYADPERYRSHPNGIAFERRDISYVAVAALAAWKGDA